MASNSTETDFNDEEPQIKLERLETWDMPPEVDLISDDETENELAGSSDAQVPSVSGGSEKSGLPSRTDLEALQKRLADKYRTKTSTNPEKQLSPRPGPEPESEPEDEDEDEDAQKDAHFEQATKIYNRKKKAGKLSIEDEIVFMRLEGEHITRKRKAEADTEYDRSPSDSPEPETGEGNDLFVPHDKPRFSELFSDDEEDDEDDAPKKRKRCGGGNEGPSKKRTRQRKVLGTEYTDDDVTQIIRNARKTAPKPKAKPKAKAAPKPKTKPASKGKGKSTQITNLSNLMGQDPFAAAAQNANLPSQPTFSKTGRRVEALKQLIASTGEDHRGTARSDLKYLDAAIKDFTGVASVQAASDGNWRVKGMRTTLKHFQVLGTSFMRKQETKDRGGILADEMGLGKTIMMLANIINGKPNQQKKNKTTLIVASPALVSQWSQEIRRHCFSYRENKHGIGTVIQHRAGHKINSNDIMSVFDNADVVLSTYSEISSSYPKAIVPPELVTAQAKDRWWSDYFQQNRGPFHSIKWLRVVLDEAQAIKNHRSHTSLACRALQSRFTWAITGTPIQNGIKEFYPYFKLLRVPNTGSYKVFKENFCSPNDPDGATRLNVFLRTFMIRRTHLDTFAGARLLDLPTPTQKTMWLEFCDIERSLYDIVKKRFVERINTMSKNGTLNKGYGSIWAMVVRLRQMCAHIMIISSTCLDLLEREDFELLNTLTQNEDEQSEEGRALLLHLKNVLRSEVGLTNEVIETGAGSTIIQESETLATGVLDWQGYEAAVGGNHGQNYRFRRHLNGIKGTEVWDEMAKRVTCCGCRQQPLSPYITSCYHIFCYTCLKDLQHLAARRGRDHRCSECGTAYTSSEPLDDHPEPKSKSSSSDSSESGEKSNKKKKDDGLDWINTPGEILPSAKTMAIKAAIMNYLEDDPSTKIIVYTQWRPMVEIIARVCTGEGWGFCRYTGTMSHDSRGKAIHDFSNKPDKNVLLCGLKCGGLGLNLTAATKVLLVDPWYNNATEHQAFARCYRIGQTKETTLVKLVVKNTIDQAMMAIKERKQIEIDDVMSSEKMKEKLSVEDLMRLFGKVAEDEGKPFIFADEPEDPHLRLANVDEEDEMGFIGNEE